MEDNKEKSMESTAESVEKTAETEQKEQEKTFTRDELNKIVSAEKTKALEEYKAQVEADKSEAEKLAKMKSDEKLQYQLEKSNKEKEDALAELNAFKLKDKALEIAKEKGLDSSLLAYFDYKTIKAEELNSKIDEISTTFNKAVEKAVNERLKEETPTTKTGMEGSQPKPIPTVF